jgi:hypothetical protein
MVSRRVSRCCGLSVARTSWSACSAAREACPELPQPGGGQADAAAPLAPPTPERRRTALAFSAAGGLAHLSAAAAISRGVERGAGLVCLNPDLRRRDGASSAAPPNKATG